MAGYYIDIAVRNPEAPQQFLLGIECDGAMYHSTLSARDRDRLRQEVLENLGWEIERIWSVDWFRDPERELKRVLDRLNQLQRLRKVETPAPQVFVDVGALAEDTAFASEKKHKSTRQIEGLPRQLKKALAAKSAPKNVFTGEEARAALIELREKIETECPDADPSRGLLRQNMLDELLRKRPTDADDWRAKMPLHLRQGTDGEQFKRYGEHVFEILATET